MKVVFTFIVAAVLSSCNSRQAQTEHISTIDSALHAQTEIILQQKLTEIDNICTSKPEHTPTSATLLLAQFYKEHLSLLNPADRKKFLTDKADETDSTFYIQFRQPINDYRVKASFIHPDTTCCDIIVFGSLYFINDRSEVCELYHRLFFADTVKLHKHTINEIDYIIPTINHAAPVCLQLFRNLPFSFLDVDFDGHEELLLTLPTIAQRTASAYSVCRIGTKTKDGVLSCEEDTIYHNLFDNDFTYCLDDFTELDFTKKEVRFFLDAGYSGSERYFYKVKDKKTKLYKKEVYDSLGYVLAKREIYSGSDTITTYHNGRKYLFER